MRNLHYISDETTCSGHGTVHVDGTCTCNVTAVGYNCESVIPCPNHFVAIQMVLVLVVLQDWDVRNV